MFRIICATSILLSCFSCIGFSDDGNTALCHSCQHDASTVRLYFAPDTVDTNRNPKQFKPEIAKRYVDDHYVGDAIVNLHGYLPTLRFPESTLTLRIEMSDNRKFETKVTVLGHGSTQVLYVDFAKPSPKAAKKSG